MACILFDAKEQTQPQGWVTAINSKLGGPTESLHETGNFGPWSATAAKVSLPLAGAKAIESEDVSAARTPKGTRQRTSNAEAHNTSFGKALGFKKWADIDDDYDSEEEMTLPDFGLQEQQDSVEFGQEHLPSPPNQTTYEEQNAREFSNTTCVDVYRVSTNDHMNPLFYVHRTSFHECSPAAFSHEIYYAGQKLSSEDVDDQTQKKASHERKTRKRKNPPSVTHWNPTKKELTLMCAALKTCTQFSWSVLSAKSSEKSRWTNKCLQKSIITLTHGHVRRHAEQFFNSQCANDNLSGFGSSVTLTNVDAVCTFLDLHNSHVTVLENVTAEEVEKFQLGNGTKCLGTLFWDADSTHVTIVKPSQLLFCMETCVSAAPWTRSAVGSDGIDGATPYVVDNNQPTPHTPEIHKKILFADRLKFNPQQFRDSFLAKQKKSEQETRSCYQDAPVESPKRRSNLTNALRKEKVRVQKKQQKQISQKARETRNVSNTSSAIRRREIRAHVKSEDSHPRSKCALNHPDELNERGEISVRASGPLPPRTKTLNIARLRLNFTKHDYPQYRQYKKHTPSHEKNVALNGMKFDNISEEDLCAANTYNLRRFMSQIGERWNYKRNNVKTGKYKNCHCPIHKC